MENARHVDWSEDVISKIPLGAYKLLKQMNDGEDYDKNSGYMSCLEKCKYVKDGNVTRIGKYALQLKEEEVVEMRKSSHRQIKRV